MVRGEGELGPPTARERFSWCLFDFANSSFNTIVITFVYVTFFAKVLAGGGERGDLLWGGSLTVAAVAVAVLSPLLGTLADQRRGNRKRFLIATTLTTIVCTALLALPAVDPGTGQATAAAVWTALVLVTVANTAFELTFVFYNSFLPGLGDQQTVGRLSGKAWALGYVGGLACLVIALGFVGKGGLGPWLSDEGHFDVRATNLLVAGWFLVFALPMFLWVRDRGGDTPGAFGAERPGRLSIRASVREVVHTLGRLRDYPDLLRLLLARLFYNDAVIAIIGLAALYMQRTLGMPDEDIITVGIWLNVAAGFGAFGFGWLDDRVGAKAAVLGSLALLIAGGTLAIAVPTVGAFWVAATLVGIGLGPNQAASRSMLARFISPRRSGEFYGLFALSGKATVWLGPLLFTIVVGSTGSQRLGLLPLIGMLVLGGVIFLGVDERRGIARARADERAREGGREGSGA